MKYYIRFIVLLNAFLVACGGNGSERSDALEIQAEMRRVGVGAFVEKIDPNLSVAVSKSHYVDFREMPLLSTEIKAELAGCYVIGDKLNPNGIFFQSFKGEDYYVCLDGGGVPVFF